MSSQSESQGSNDWPQPPSSPRRPRGRNPEAGPSRGRGHPGAGPSRQHMRPPTPLQVQGHAAYRRFRLQQVYEVEPERPEGFEEHSARGSSPSYSPTPPVRPPPPNLPNSPHSETESNNVSPPGRRRNTTETSSP